MIVSVVCIVNAVSIVSIVCIVNAVSIVCMYRKDRKDGEES